jgi:hypothetical protein
VPRPKATPQPDVAEPPDEGAARKSIARIRALIGRIEDLSDTVKTAARRLRRGAGTNGREPGQRD